MQIISYELLGFCFHFPEQLFNFNRLEIENYLEYHCIMNSFIAQYFV